MSTRDRNLLVGVVLALLLGAFWMLALSPRREEAATVADQVAAAQQQRDEAVRQAEIARTAAREYAGDYAAVALLGKAVPAEDDTASLLFQLQDAAGRSDVELTSITPTGPNGAPAGNAATANAAAPTATAGPGVNAMKLDLTFGGTYRDLQRFIRRVQQFTDVEGRQIRVEGRLLSIDGFDFAMDEDGRITANIMATAYVAAPAPAADPAAGAAGATPDSADASATQTARPPATAPATVVAGG